MLHIYILGLSIQVTPVTMLEQGNELHCGRVAMSSSATQGASSIVLFYHYLAAPCHETLAECMIIAWLQVLKTPADLSYYGTGPMVSARMHDLSVLWHRTHQMFEACSRVGPFLLHHLLLLPTASCPDEHIPSSVHLSSALHQAAYKPFTNTRSCSWTVGNSSSCQASFMLHIWH